MVEYTNNRSQETLKIVSCVKILTLKLTHHVGNVYVSVANILQHFIFRKEETIPYPIVPHINHHL